MIRIYLCDDEWEVLDRYQRLTQETLKARHISAEIKLFASGEQLLFHIMENPNEANIIFLDMLMDKMTGIDTAKQLRNAGCYAEIIYLTANREMVFDAFDTTPFHYLVKGSVTEKRFSEILLKAVAAVEKKNRDFFFCARGAVRKQIPLYSISHFTIDGRIVTVHYSAKTFAFYSKIESLQRNLEEKGFARCHRSVLVNLRFIDEIRREEIILANNIKVPFGATYIKAFKATFSEYLSQTVSS